jgi:transcription antitermination factor NusG
MNTGKKWLAVYTRPRCEKKVNELLMNKGFESYCPLNKVHRKWSDRIKLVEEPLFKSYVFVHIADAEQTAIRMVNGVLNFVYWLGKPAIIKPREIERIKRFLNDYDDVTTESLSIQPNDKVLVKSGALMDKEATVLRQLGNRVELEIESLGYKLVAYVDKKNLSKLVSGQSSAGSVE